jgi:NADH-quinone oxidoreductase subunit C
MPASTKTLSGPELAERVRAAVPDAVDQAGEGYVLLRNDKLLDVARYLRDEREIDARYLNALSGVDRYDHFEVVYQLTSLSHNHTFAIKVRANREQPEVPSVASIWHGAHLQEREVFDLLGVRFSGHPDLKRLFLWEGFPGHPLRKDFMTLPQGVHPGLQRFPKEAPDAWGGEFRGDQD